MKIRYLGTAAAEGVPAMFCNCNFCQMVRAMGPSEFRTRSQVLVDDVLSVDFPSEAFVHSLQSGVSFANLKYILFTHSHFDHCYAHDFVLHGYKYARSLEPLLSIYGNSEILKVFGECTAREMLPDVLSHIKLTQIEPYTAFYAGEYRVLTIKAKHCLNEVALLYYIEKGGKGYLHLYDTKRLEMEDFGFLKANGAHADVVSLDCTYLTNTERSNARHMGLDDDVYERDLLLSSGIADSQTKFVLTHFSHNGNPSRANVNALADKFGFIAAYDGMLLEI